MARYIGTISDYEKFIGPHLTNTIQNLTRGERSRRKGDCELCGKKAELQSAHKHGKERKTLMHEVLKKYFNGSFLEIDDIEKCENEIVELHKPINETFYFICQACHKKYDNKNNEGDNRKSQVLKILEEGPASINELAEKLNITSRNISSILTGLKKDGYIIHTDNEKRKYLVMSENATTL